MARTKAQQAKAAVVQPIAPDTGTILTHYYQVMTDGIAVGDGTVANGPAILKGRVTAADLSEAGVDIAWLLRTGDLEDLGYA